MREDALDIGNYFSEVTYSREKLSERIMQEREKSMAYLKKAL